VAGATGVVGRHVVAALAAAGHDVRPLSRSSGVDVVTGQGLAAALVGVDAVVDVTNVLTLRRRTAERFFTTTARNLVAAPHLVVLSVVGCDVVPSGYYQGKLEQERLLLGSYQGVTLLRATQFHEFAEQVLARGPGGPLRFVPRMRVQPVAAAEVGQALADLAAGAPQGRVADLGGPEVHELPDLVRRVLAARGSRARVLAVRPPGRLGRQLARGGLLPAAGGAAGQHHLRPVAGGFARALTGQACGACPAASASASACSAAATAASVSVTASSAAPAANSTSRLSSAPR
jgi:uncharacterized protein YbjT (DUF2867 family)